MSEAVSEASSAFPSERTILLGIDIGGTKIAGGLVDAETGEALHSGRVPTDAQEGSESVLERAIEMARILIGEGLVKKIPLPVAIGIGAGGQIDPTSGVVLSATEILPGWAGTPLQMVFEEAFGLPVAVDNDVNALGAGESRFGAGRGFQNVVFLALGTGVGGAILANGQLYHGARGAGGELGHLILHPDGPAVGSDGERGTLEYYTNGAALVRYYQEAGGDPTLDGPAIGAEARQAPDSAAAGAVRRIGESLGLGIVSLANLLDPDRFVIGGGMADLGDLLLDPARAVLAARALPIVRHIPIVRAALGADASVVGAASLALSLI
ncbi:MAG: ROK family protein [Cytophagales bacterium]|nr:ROK family protein [Armatimonadota bacterium]